MGEAKRRAADRTPLGDGPIQSDFREALNAIADVLDETFNGEARGADRKIGFVLLTFPYDAPAGRANYISNGADRKDICVMMREQIARFEGQPEVSGNA